MSMMSRLGPNVLVYVLWIVSGLLGAVLSKGLFGVWFWLEWGFVGAICIVSGISLQENEGAMKYFIFQSLGSMMIFFSIVMVSCGGVISMWSGSMSGFLGVAMKLGIFPFHFWVPSVMGLVSWNSCFIVGWTQKVAPLWVISYCKIPSNLHGAFEISAFATSAVGALGGMGVLSYRVLVSYSSLVHTGWLMSVCMYNSFFLCVYLLVYGAVFLGSVISFKKNNLQGFADHCNLLKEETSVMGREFSKLEITVNLCSLSGMPPFLGGVVKLLSIYVLWYSSPILCVVLTGCSIVSFYFYLSLIINCFTETGSNISYFFGMGKNYQFNLLQHFNIFEVIMFVVQMWGGIFVLSILGVLT